MLPTAHPPADAAAAQIFRALRRGPQAVVTRHDIETFLEENGIGLDDPRIRETMKALRQRSDREPLDEDLFAQIVDAANVTLIHRALKGELIVPDFARFRNRIGAIFDFVRDYTGGEVADYIPQLARVDPDMFAVSVCTVDGQRFSFGDADESYCVQSTCKPINYGIALDLLGIGTVHQHVGREPSGRSFNELTLNSRGLPHNPMINVGAIMCTSLIKPNAPLADRFDYVMSVWRSLSGNQRPGFDNSVYLSEKETADRNFALAYFMRENRAFPADTNLLATLEFYFQCCSITVNAKQMAVVASTMANGGICPLTNKRVFSSETTKNCLSLMYSWGMYDFSGEYAFSVGLPAKSGVSGSLFIVVPGLCGIAIWSPRLDRLGNSVRGVEFSKRLVEAFPFHTYAGMVSDRQLFDPRRSDTAAAIDSAYHLCAAAARGDVNELRRLVACNTPLDLSDYDGRTALHLAASENHLAALDYLLLHGAPIAPIDRWGNTPLDDALRAGHEQVVERLRQAAASPPSSEAEAEDTATAPRARSSRKRIAA